MTQHVYHLNRINIGEISHVYLTLNATKTIVQELGLFRIGLTVYGLPNTQIQRLQRIRYITHLKTEKIRPTFNLLLLTYKSLNGQS